MMTIRVLKEQMPMIFIMIAEVTGVADVIGVTTCQ